MSRRERIDQLLTYALVVAALIIAGDRLYSRVEHRLAGSEPGPETVDLDVSDWDVIVREARPIKDAARAVTVVQFTDYQCPYCRQFHLMLDSVSNAIGVPLRSGIIHFPIRSHQHARSAAIAAECAAQQGRFAQFHDALLREQSRIGVADWGYFGSRAGLSDSTRFARCVADQATASAVDADTALARRYKVIATPTVVIDGKRYAVPPTANSLAASLRKARRT